MSDLSALLGASVAQFTTVSTTTSSSSTAQAAQNVNNYLAEVVEKLTETCEGLLKSLTHAPSAPSKTDTTHLNTPLAGAQFGTIQNSPSTVKNDDYPNLTPEDLKAIDDNLSSIEHWPYEGMSREDLEKSLKQELNEAKGTAQSLLGHSVSLTDSEICRARDNVVIREKDPMQQNLDVSYIMQDNTSLSPEEAAYASRFALTHNFHGSNDDFGSATGILKNLIAAVDAKKGGHMSDADIDLLWNTVQSYVDANPDVMQDFVDCKRDGRSQYGINLTTKDYQNILNQYFAGSGSVPEKDSNYPNLTSEEMKLIDNSLNTIQFPHLGMSREEMKKTLEGRLNYAKGQAESLQGHSISLTAKQIKFVLSPIGCGLPDSDLNSSAVKELMGDYD